VLVYVPAFNGTHCTHPRWDGQAEFSYVSDYIQDGLPIMVTNLSTNRARCRGKFVAPGKFFPPPYCHNVTNVINPNPIPNPNLNLILTLILTLLLTLILNLILSLILTLTRTAACGNNFQVRRIFHYTGLE